MSSRKKHLFKILILGDTGVGKTSLMNQYVSNKFTGQYKATLGADFLSKEVMVDDRFVTMQIWDTAGQERFMSLGVAFYRGADAVILVFDVNTAQSLDNLKTWKDEFIKQASPPNPESFPFLVIGNKIDLENRAVTQKKANQWCQENGGLPYYETSAKEALNVNQAFQQAAKLAMDRNQTDVIFDDIKTVSVQPNNNGNTNGDGCPC